MIPVGLMIYCNWVQSEVEQKDLNEHCDSQIKDGKCHACERSPQLDYGVKPSEIIRNITRS